MAWRHGEKKVFPKKFRCTLAAACNPTLYPMLKTSQLPCEYVDFLNYCLSGVLPCTKNRELGCSYKGELRTAFKVQYDAKLKKNQSRLDVISEDLDNLPMAAVRLGYPVELMSPPVRSTMQRMRRDLDMASYGGGMPGAPAASGMLALGNGPRDLGMSAREGLGVVGARVGVEVEPVRRAEPAPEEPAEEDEPVEAAQPLRASFSLPTLHLPRPVVAGSRGRRVRAVRFPKPAEEEAVVDCDGDEEPISNIGEDLLAEGPQVGQIESTHALIEEIHRIHDAHRRL